MQPPSVEDVLSLAYPAAKIALTLAVDAGLRAGEIRGQRWTDVDVDTAQSGYLSVTQRYAHTSEVARRKVVERLAP